MAPSEMEREAAFVELMDATEEYTLVRGQLDAAMKQGTFNIAQARYAMSGPLGRTQYDTEMEATTKVVVLAGQTSWSDSEDDDETAPVPVPLFKLSAQSTPAPATDKQPSSSTGTSSRTDTAAADSSASTATTLQRRRGGKSDEASSTAAGQAGETHAHADNNGSKAGGSGRGAQRQGEAEGSKSIGTASGQHRSKDPLRWFGVLVPQPLRTAQTHFNKAIGHCVDLGNAKQRLLNAIRKWEALEV